MGGGGLVGNMGRETAGKGVEAQVEGVLLANEKLEKENRYLKEQLAQASRIARLLFFFTLPPFLSSFLLPFSPLSLSLPSSPFSRIATPAETEMGNLLNGMGIDTELMEELAKEFNARNVELENQLAVVLKVCVLQLEVPLR